MIREAALYQKAGFRVWQNGEIVGGVLFIATEQKQKKEFRIKNITAYQRYTNLFAPQPSPALKPVLKNQYCACAVISIKCGMCQVSAGWRSCAIIADICGWYLINILVPSRLAHFWVRVQKFLYSLFKIKSLT